MKNNKNCFLEDLPDEAIPYLMIGFSVVVFSLAIHLIKQQKEIL